MESGLLGFLASASHGRQLVGNPHPEGLEKSCRYYNSQIELNYEKVTDSGDKKVQVCQYVVIMLVEIETAKQEEIDGAY